MVKRTNNACLGRTRVSISRSLHVSHNSHMCQRTFFGYYLSIVQVALAHLSRSLEPSVYEKKKGLPAATAQMVVKALKLKTGNPHFDSQFQLGGRNALLEIDRLASHSEAPSCLPTPPASTDTTETRERDQTKRMGDGDPVDQGSADTPKPDSVASSKRTMFEPSRSKWSWIGSTLSYFISPEGDSDTSRT
jgi:hypothetical protein